jgi:hypothetical protein
VDNDIETNKHVCFQSNTDGTHLVSDDEEEGSMTSSAINPEITVDGMREENIADFMTKDLPVQHANVIEDEDEPLAAENPQAELLRWHYQLGCLSFARLHILALLGTIPQKLLTIKAPKCAGCMYGAMTQRPWRTRGTQNKNKLRVATAPGECISISQLESPVQGFIGQLKGKLTKRQYGATTIFVDDASQLSYVHLQS